MNNITCIPVFVVLLVSSVGVAGCAKEVDTGAEVNI